MTRPSLGEVRLGRNVRGVAESDRALDFARTGKGNSYGGWAVVSSHKTLASAIWPALPIRRAESKRALRIECKSLQSCRPAFASRERYAMRRLLRALGVISAAALCGCMVHSQPRTLDVAPPAHLESWAGCSVANALAKQFARAAGLMNELDVKTASMANSSARSMLATPSQRPLDKRAKKRGHSIASDPKSGEKPWISSDRERSA